MPWKEAVGRCRVIEYGQSQRRYALSPSDCLNRVPGPREDGTPAETLRQKEDLADIQRVNVGELICSDQDLKRDAKIRGYRCQCVPRLNDICFIWRLRCRPVWMNKCKHNRQEKP